MIIEPALPDRVPAPAYRVFWGASGQARLKGQVFFHSCTADEQARFTALFLLIEESHDGRLANQTSFKWPLKGQGNLGEIKIHGKRLFFFRHNHQLIIVSGCTKRRDDTKDTELERAERIKTEIEKEIEKG